MSSVRVIIINNTNIAIPLNVAITIIKRLLIILYLRYIPSLMSQQMPLVLMTPIVTRGNSCIRECAKSEGGNR
jgi:hypothetical protein